MKSAIRLLIVIALGAGALFLPANAAPKATCDLTAGDYIVSFKGGVNVSNELKNIHGRQVTPKYQYDKVLNGFAGTLSAEEVCDLKNNPRVSLIESDGNYSIDANIQSADPFPSWGLDRIDQNIGTNNEYSYTNEGSGTVAYVIDTGILTTHPDFGGRASIGYDALSPTSPKQDCNGHGTHVAGTIGGKTYGVAKNVKLVAVRVLDCRGSSKGSSVLSGIDWVVKDHLKRPTEKAVANMSLGGGYSATLNNAVTSMVTKGIVSVVAAGNSSANAINYSPASAPLAITVAASDKTDTLADYSNYGSVVDVIAPGTWITSDYLNNSTATLRGTSMASPHVAGLMALLLSSSNPNYAFDGKVPVALLSTVNIKLSSAATSAGTTQKLIYTNGL